MSSNRDEKLLEFVKKELDSARGKWPEIAKVTGVPYFTITNLVQGKVEDPRISTMQPLIDYFRARKKRVA